MSSIIDKAACAAAGEGQERGLLPVSPFTALQFHFGMLLGVDDLDTLQAYARGKTRVHNAWLHREGVVWGFNVRIKDPDSRAELAVDPGLALDAAGHELHLDVPACLDLGKWFAKHKDDPGFTSTAEGDSGGRTFAVHVVARFKACLTRPIPAIADPCAGAETDTAYSRAFETVELLLRPGLAPLKKLPYHRLRILFGLEDAGPPDQDKPPYTDSSPYSDAVDRRATILGLPLDQQPRAYLKAFRELAAFDEIDLSPQAGTDGNPGSIFPEDPTEVVLADIADIHVMPSGESWALASPLPKPDVRVRPSHVATSTIQELLCGPLFDIPVGAPPSTDAPPLARDAPPPAVAEPGRNTPLPPQRSGPQIIPASVAISSNNKLLTLSANAALNALTVTADQFAVTTFSTDEGWSHIEIRQAKLDDGGTTISLELREAATNSLVRVMASGRGATPILGTNLVPLAGAVGGPPGIPDEGKDFVLMLRRN